MLFQYILLCRQTLCFRLRGGASYGFCVERIFSPRFTNSVSNNWHNVSKRGVDTTTALPAAVIVLV